MLKYKIPQIVTLIPQTTCIRLNQTVLKEEILNANCLTFRILLRAEDGAQTRDPQLGRLMLYQLSYFRNFLWAKMDSNHRSRKTADLQSAPFGHSGICPTYFQRTTASQHLFLSLLSDSNQRPRDYKSRALAN